MLKDNKEKNDVINKLICFSESLKNAPMSENDVLKPITMRKDHTHRSHDIAQ